MKRAAFLAVLLTLVGCSTLVPKKVEFFQDKVQAFPEQSAALREVEKQAIYRARDKAAEVVVAAVTENASTNVVAPAQEVARVTQAIATVEGPPLKPAPPEVSTTNLAIRLETAVAKFDKKVEAFKADNNENIGKKIEGTGLVQISYFYWVGGIVVGLLILFAVGKLLLTAASVANPGAAVGLNLLNATGALATKGFSQVVKGGEEFKAWVEKEIQDSGVKQKILDAFQSTHKQAQDKDVQDVIRSITN